VKRAIVIVTFLVLSAALFAQVRGVPSSVTSYGQGRGAAPGVPASVTSLGPNGYGGPCTQPGCAYYYPQYPIGATPGSIGQSHHGGGHGGGGHHGGNGSGNGGHHSGGYSGGYLYVPYAVPVVAEPEEPLQAEEPDPPAPTIFEHRPNVQPGPYANDESRYGEHYLDAREQSATQPRIAAKDEPPKHVNLSPVSEEVIPVVIVYKNGTQQEIKNGNYAIVGDMLYDLSGTIAHKVKLSDLDLKKTVLQNEQRGVDFNLPASLKPEA
jgi:hypothetical protein